MNDKELKETYFKIATSKNPSNLLRKRRIDLGMTQRELSKKWGVINSVVSDYETGKRNKLIGLAFFNRWFFSLYENSGEKKC